MHSEAKGLGDLIRAIKLLHERGRQVRLTCMGPGEINRSEELAIANGLRDHVSFTGRVTHDEVFKRMRSSDLIVIPSRPKYPEGLPRRLCVTHAPDRVEPSNVSRRSCSRTDGPDLQGLVTQRTRQCYGAANF